MSKVVLNILGHGLVSSDRFDVVCCKYNLSTNIFFSLSKCYIKVRQPLNFNVWICLFFDLVPFSRFCALLWKETSSCMQFFAFVVTVM